MVAAVLRDAYILLAWWISTDGWRWVMCATHGSWGSMHLRSSFRVRNETSNGRRGSANCLLLSSGPVTATHATYSDCTAKYFVATSRDSDSNTEEADGPSTSMMVPMVGWWYISSWLATESC